MKKIFSITLLAVLLLAASCSKDKNDNGGPVTQKRIKSTTLDEAWSFAYNADGTLKEITGPSGFKQTVKYEAGKVTAETRWSGVLTAKGEWTMTNGKPVKLVWSYFDNMGQPAGGNVYNFEFNAKGLLAKRIYDDNSYEEFEYDANDDLTRKTIYSDQGIADFKTEYEYGNQLDRFPQYTAIRTDIEGFLFPPLSKHLPVSKKEIPLPANVVTYHLTYAHELDADGYVVKGTATSQTPGYSGYSWTHTY